MGKVIDGHVDNPRIVRPSADRVKPICAHYKTCGGCQLQHASDDFVANWKRQSVVSALSRFGLGAVEVASIDTSPTHSRRRVKIGARRTKIGSICGYHAYKSHNLLDVIDCPLLEPELGSVFDLGRALAVVGASRKGALDITVTLTRDGLDVSVQGGKPLDPKLSATLPKIAIEHGCTRLSWDGELVVASSATTVEIANTRVKIPQNSFLQATKHGEEALQRVVCEALKGGQRSLDLFSGCGTFALALADVMHVTAIEGDPRMTEALKDASNHSAKRFPVRTQVRDMFRDPLSVQELGDFDAVCLDPPRAGALSQVREISQSQIPRVAYVSCNPATFARDAAEMVGHGYTLKPVHVVDQFRWSSHVELAGCFTKE